MGGSHNFEEGMTCSQGEMDLDYDLAFHIAAIFIVMIVSLLSTTLPIVFGNFFNVNLYLVKS